LCELATALAVPKVLDDLLANWRGVQRESSPRVSPASAAASD
jgi:hypothetical protein